MNKTLKSFFITIFSLFIYQESLNAMECNGKVVGGPLSGKKAVISKILPQDRVEIFSLLNSDKKDSSSEVRRSWFDNYEKLKSQFPKVNTVKIIDQSNKIIEKDGRRFYQDDKYFIPKSKTKNEYWEITNNGNFWANSTEEVWPFLGSDDVIYSILFKPYTIITASGPEPKCVFKNKHNSVVLSNGARYFAYEFSLGPQVYMVPKNTQNWKMITGHVLKFSYYPVELEEIGGSIPGFQFK